MRVGISVQSVYPGVAVRDGARQMILRARAAEAAGLDSLFVGDHHATPVPYYQNVPILARMLAEWGPRPAGALFLLPLWHPLIVAEQVGTLAALMQGPFVLQCAVGPDDAQFPAMGVDAAERRVRFEAALAILRGLLAGETLTCDGPYPLDGARISPVPEQPVAIWIGGVARVAIERAARLGDGWLASPSLGLAAAREQLEVYTNACARHGRPVGARVIRRDVYVGESADEAVRTAGPVIAGGYRGFPEEAVVVGDVERVCESLRALADIGYDEVLVRHLVQDPDAVQGSIGRLAAVRAALA